MFWATILEPGKAYIMTKYVPFHLSMVSLVPLESDSPDLHEYVKVIVLQDAKLNQLCTLKMDEIMQVPLNLNFASKKVTFLTNSSKCHVHLTGYIISPDDIVKDIGTPPEIKEITNHTQKSDNHSDFFSSNITPSDSSSEESEEMEESEEEMEESEEEMEETEEETEEEIEYKESEKSRKRKLDQPKQNIKRSKEDKLDKETVKQVKAEIKQKLKNKQEKMQKIRQQSQIEKKSHELIKKKKNGKKHDGAESKIQ